MASQNLDGVKKKIKDEGFYEPNLLDLFIPPRIDA